MQAAPSLGDDALTQAQAAAAAEIGALAEMMRHPPPLQTYAAQAERAYLAVGYLAALLRAQVRS